MDGKVIRFYPNSKPREIMDIMTIDDLKAAGFVPYRYIGTRDPKTGKWARVEDPKRMVYKTVPPGENFQAANAPDYAYPVIRFELGIGYEAKYGAIRYQLRNPKELHEFMKVFNYPIPNGTESKN